MQKRRAALVVVLLTGIGGVPLAADVPVHPTPEAVEPLQPGARIPRAHLQTVGGESLDLTEAVRDTGALLVFYRGGW